jgi:hypothetical protein
VLLAAIRDHHRIAISITMVRRFQPEPAGKFLEADCDAGLAGAHALKQGGLLGVGGRLLPLASEQVTHPRGRLIQRCCHGGSIPQSGHNTAPAAGQGLLLKPIQVVPPP